MIRIINICLSVVCLIIIDELLDRFASNSKLIELTFTEKV